MINLRNERGSITLVVLVSCMFLIASVACTQVYIESKKTAVDREYRQTKSNYEKDSFDENVLKSNYEQLSKTNNVTINVLRQSILNGTLILEFNVNDENLNVKTVKYGWGTSDSIETVAKWSYIEGNTNNNSSMVVLKDNAGTEETYNLFIVINNKEIYLEVNT